jgi:uncharacterized protein
MCRFVVTKAIQHAGPRFKNMVAGHLLKYCHHLEHTEGAKMDLRFLRDIDGREIDFVVYKDKVPILAVECKSGERAPAPAIGYFQQRTSISEFYHVHLATKNFGRAKTGRALPFAKFCELF